MNSFHKFVAENKSDVSMLKDSFLKYLLLERNYSEKTILSYGIDLDEFEAYFKGVDVELEFTSVDADVVRGWVLSLMDEGRAETTVNRKLSSLRSFIIICYVRSWWRWIRWQKLSVRKKEAFAGFVRDEAMSQLLDGFEFPQTFEGVRDKTMLEVFYSTGMRRAELIALRDGDVDFRHW